MSLLINSFVFAFWLNLINDLILYFDAWWLKFDAGGLDISLADLRLSILFWELETLFIKNDILELLDSLSLNALEALMQRYLFI